MSEQVTIDCRIIDRDLASLIEQIETKHGRCNVETWSTLMHLTNEVWSVACRETFHMELESFSKPPTSKAFISRYAQTLRVWIEQMQENIQEESFLNPFILHMLFEIGSLHRVNWEVISETLITAFISENANTELQ